MQQQASTNRLIGILCGIAMIAMIAAYFAPIWWVSLAAPNYPKDAFPQGIRIHFHFDGVYNGCSVQPQGKRQNEILQQDLSGEVERYNPVLNAQADINKGAQGLDCLHEMNTINHYVGMFPISTGAPVERHLAKYFFAFFAVMLLAFAVPEQRRRWRLGVLGVGFAAVAAWLLVDQYLLGQLAAHVRSYVSDAVYYFNEPEKIHRWGDTVRRVTNITIAGFIVAMVALFIGTARLRRFVLLLALVPALLPLYFLMTYAGWLWFFGHNLHPWGAFTVKPFMPTLFGEGKVAQFSTYSYPSWGYALLLVVFLCLIPALLLRRQQLRGPGSS
jgi:hypothetical protein